MYVRVSNGNGSFDQHHYRFRAAIYWRTICPYCAIAKFKLVTKIAASSFTDWQGVVLVFLVNRMCLTIDN